MAKVMRICEACGKEFYVYPSYLKRHNGRFCSRECYKPTLEMAPCVNCGKMFKPLWSRCGEGRMQYCSRKCYGEHKAKPTEQRFWSYVKKTNVCWLWTGTPNQHGYGIINVGTKPGNVMIAHRFSWELHKSPVPDGLFVLHHCDNRMCVNPDHLFLGTIPDNNADKCQKGRQTKGEEQHLHKLTDEDVREIRQAYQPGVVRLRDLAEKYGVSESVISVVKDRKSWKHVE
jgi:HNH endonuclease